MKSKDIGTLISVLILIATVATLFFYRTKIIEKITELKDDILPDRREKEKETKPEPQTETGKASIQLQNLPEIIQPQFVTQPIVADVQVKPTSITHTGTIELINSPNISAGVRPTKAMFLQPNQVPTFAEKIVLSKRQPTSAEGIARLAISKNVTKATSKSKPVIIGTKIIKPSGSTTTSFTQTVTHPDLVSTKTTKIFIKGTGSGSSTIGKKPSTPTPTPKVQKAKSKSG